MQTYDPQAPIQNSAQPLATGAAGTISNERETTVDRLSSALETSTDQLRPATPKSATWLDEFLAEAACQRAVELACVIGVDTAPQSPIHPEPIDESLQTKEIGPYQLLSWWGQGGMGTVYKARHRRLDKIVALKVIQTRRLQQPEMLQRFQREMRAIGNLDHPNLLRALDAGDDHGIHYLAMEFADGFDLAELVAQGSPLSIADACELILQAASGLHAAHSRGIIHRDIKPANLILTFPEFGPPILKILDLGLALFTTAAPDDQSGITGADQIMGTVEYMAPEQADNSHAVDQRADIYSLGATLYTLLTGRPLFAERLHLTLMQKLSLLANDLVQPIRERRPEISQPLAAIVHRMLARNPTERFASMSDIIVELKPYTVGANLATLLHVIADQQIIRQRDMSVPVNAPTESTPRLDPQFNRLLPQNDLKSLPHTSTSDSFTGNTNAVDSGSSISATRLLELSLTTVPTGNTLNRTPSNQGISRLAAVTRWTSRSWIRVTAIALLAVVLCSSIILSLKSPAGELKVEIPDNLPEDIRQELKIEVNGNGNARVLNEANGWSIGVSEGKYQIRLTGGGDRLLLENNQVTVTRDKQAIVTVTLTPPQLAVEKTTIDQQGYRWPQDEPPPAIAPFTRKQARDHQTAWARNLGLPVEYTNSLGMQLILIPPGEFLMGSSPAEQASVMEEAIALMDERWVQFIKSEGPQHKVILTRPIYLGMNEVSQSQYQTIMGKNPSAYLATNPIGRDSVKDIDTTNFPVDSTQYEEMTEFCLKLSQREGIESLELTPGSSVALMKDTRGYRLPTEAEWEFACRAGTTTRYWNGEREVDLLSSSWPKDGSHERPFPIGTTRANPFGLYDMLSNLTELTLDEDDPSAPTSYYSQFKAQPAINPKGRPAQVFRVGKGGNFHSPAWQARAARRWIHALGHGSPETGFRVAISCEAVRENLKPKLPDASTTTGPDRSANESN